MIVLGQCASEMSPATIQFFLNPELDSNMDAAANESVPEEGQRHYFKEANLQQGTIE